MAYFTPSKIVKLQNGNIDAEQICLQCRIYAAYQIEFPKQFLSDYVYRIIAD